MDKYIAIDGSLGEGGGQILRTALALSLITQTPFRIEKIRAKRKNPGLLRQHLTAVTAAATIGRAQISGANIGSMELSFIPREIREGNYSFAVGTAGSATLVLQTVLPALLMAKKPSTLTISGGTHNPAAPPFDFLAKVFLPLINRMGAKVSVKLVSPGFYPAGGGKFTVNIEPGTLKGIELLNRGDILARRACAMVSSLPKDIAERELNVVAKGLSWPENWLRIETVEKPVGPGNIVMIEVESEHLTEMFTGFGQRGLRAESVAEQAVKATRRYLSADVAVGEYLADQLLLPLALAGEGAFISMQPSLHTRTNIEVLQKFLSLTIKVSRQEGERHLISFSR